MSVVSTQPVNAGQVYMASGQLPQPLLYDFAGRLITQAALHSPIDYGPGAPLAPRIPVPDHPPREFQYQVGYNLITTPRTEGGKEYSFAQLRAWADLCPYYRLAVEHRKKQVRGRKWEVVPIEDPKSPAAKRKHQAAIDRATEWLRLPNRVDRIRLSTWLGQAIEESLVVDALAFFKQRHFDGGLSLVQIDGSTIKPLIDEWGHVIGYQQILYGYPATQYRVNVAGEYSLGEMAYWVYSPRVTNTYGTSAIEEILPAILTAVKRSQTQLAWYTDGTVPDAFLNAPENWTPEQIKSYQTWMDAEFTGDVTRRKIRILPNGASYTQAKPFAFNKDEEEAIAALILAHMGVPKHVLVSQVNRATAEVQSDDSADVGLVPLLTWFEENLTDIVQDDLGFSDLQVVCTDGLARQAEADAKADAILVGANILTPDEARAKRGLDPMVVENAEKNTRVAPEYLTRAVFEAGVMTRDELRAALGLPPAAEGGTDYVTIGAFGVTAPDKIADEAQAPKAAAPGVEGPDRVLSASVTRDAMAELRAGALESDAAKSERAQWRAFAVKRVAKGRACDPFACHHIPADEAASIRRALAAARTREDVARAFQKKALTEEVKERAVASIKAATERLFAVQYKATLKHAREVLGG